MTTLAEQILQRLSDGCGISSLYLSREWNVHHQSIVGAINSIEAAGHLINKVLVVKKGLELTDEGRLIVEKGKF